jgi:hypothetical protein
MINIYHVNVCYLGYGKLDEIDSVLKHDVYGNRSFDRFHIGCGGVNIKEINE